MKGLGKGRIFPEFPFFLMNSCISRRLQGSGRFECLPCAQFESKYYEKKLERNVFLSTETFVPGVRKLSGRHVR